MKAHFIIFLAILFASCEGTRNEPKYWSDKLEHKAFNANSFDVELAKSVIIDSSKISLETTCLDGQKAPIGVALIILIHLDERPTHLQKMEIFNWAKQNNQKLGFDIENYRNKSAE